LKPVLSIIVISQFFCTSLWLAGNGVMNDLLRTFNLDILALGHLTSAVQFGFILGTLIFAFLSLADRFPPSRVFFICAVLGAVFNLGVILENNNLNSLLLWRFLTGFSLAGIYPVGMKIAADHYREGLGKSLGYLVGALVIGTAFPHLLKTLTGSEGIPWRMVIITTSVLATLGGILILFFVPPGPYRKARITHDHFAFLKVFRNGKFRSAAFGYFGHMWELYTFWAFVPVILGAYTLAHPEVSFNIPLLSFFIIGIGGLSCVAGGYISMGRGTKKTAATALSLSGICCLISPLIFFQNSAILLIGFLLFWGAMVVADSPLFSTLVANHAEGESRGTALTIVNSIGFAITIVSIQLGTYLITFINPLYIFPILALGPLFGLWNLFRSSKI